MQGSGNNRDNCDSSGFNWCSEGSDYTVDVKDTVILRDGIATKSADITDQLKNIGGQTVSKSGVPEVNGLVNVFDGTIGHISAGVKYLEDWIPDYMVDTGSAKSLVSSVYDEVNQIAYFYGGLTFNPILYDPTGNWCYSGTAVGWWQCFPAFNGNSDLWWIGKDNVWHHDTVTYAGYPISNHGGCSLYILNNKLYIYGGVASASIASPTYCPYIMTIPIGASGPTSYAAAYEQTLTNYRALSTATKFNGDIYMIGGASISSGAWLYPNYVYCHAFHDWAYFYCDWGYQCSCVWDAISFFNYEPAGAPSGDTNRWTSPSPVVQKSTNGIVWDSCTAPPFGNVTYHQTVVYKIGGVDTLFVIGGVNASGGVPMGVYKTTDGENWEFCSNLPGGNRYGHTSVVYEGKIYVIAGYQYNSDTSTWTSVNSILTSKDGVSWREVPVHPNLVGEWWEDVEYPGEHLPEFWNRLDGGGLQVTCNGGCNAPYGSMYCWHYIYPHAGDSQPYFFASAGALAPDGSGILFMGNGGPHSITSWKYNSVLMSVSWMFDTMYPYRWTSTDFFPCVSMQRKYIAKWGKYVSRFK
jgi:hypothetical protein